jgi:hypothetical protein
MQPRVELLTVEAAFQIESVGVVVIPDFSVPRGWKNCTETVLVAKPDGQHYETTAQFNAAHFNVAIDPADVQGSIDKCWRVVVSLPNGRKDELAAGSKIMVSCELRDLLLKEQRTK